MPDNSERRNPDVDFERADIRNFAVTASGIGLLLGTILIVLLLYFPFEFFLRRRDLPEPRAELAPEYANIRQPLLQISPRADLAKLRERDRRLLEHYTWVDRSKGIVSMPVDRAIDKLVSEGMPAAADYSDLELFPPRTGSRESGFDLVPGSPGGGQR
jgi:hypothetical protein